MICQKCGEELLPKFKFCPECGFKVQSISSQKITTIPERYLIVIEEYEKLTKTKLSESERLQFVAHPSVGLLSVNSVSRRLEAAKKILVVKEDGNIYLNLFDWGQALYTVEDPNASESQRVWITSGGDKYHKSRDCKGLADGQTFATWKGKEIYRPQFISLKEAAWVLGKFPCAVCKPPVWNK